MGTVLQRFERNRRGRDFVVGDIHGCFDALRQVLDSVNFSPESDRLFSVGDIIDRGAQSLETLEWLSHPWFYPCIGNHEDMALQSMDDDEVLISWTVQNGGEWWLALDDDTRSLYVDAFNEMPLAMEIETRQGRVGIVHADIPENLSWPAFIRALEKGDAEARDIALWSRRRADGNVSAPVKGIDVVVCGHTITRDCRVHRYGNVWFIDTGAFLPARHNGRLTLLQLDLLFQADESNIS